MKIAILGTGDVGRTLGSAFVAEGHDVKMGAREAGNEKAAAWAKQAGARSPKASHGTFAEAAKVADVIVLATLGVANESALRAAGLDNLRGKLLIDTTNPLDFSKGMPPSLAVGHTDSGGEQVQRLVPEAKVVKAFNTVGNALMYKPKLSAGTPTMFIAGDDKAAKQQVSEILHAFGWQSVADMGGIVASRYLEPMCMAWVTYGIQTGSWSHAFGLITK